MIDIFCILNARGVFFRRRVEGIIITCTSKLKLVKRFILGLHLVQATSLSITDPRMGWTKEAFTRENKRIIKVVLLITDSPSLQKGM